MAYRKNRCGSRGYGVIWRFPAALLSALALGTLAGCVQPLEQDSSATILFDNTAPLAVSVNGPDLTGDPQPTWSWVPNDPEAQPVYRHRINGGPWSGPTGETSYTPGEPLQEGSYIFEVQQRDASGNWSSAAAKETLIVTAPYFITEPSPLTNQTALSWSWQSSGSISATGVFRYRVNGGSWSAETINTSQTETLADGDHSFSIQEKKNDGSWSPEVASSITVDTIPPAAPAVVAPPALSYLPVSLTVSGAPDGAGVFQYSTDNGASWSAEQGGGITIVDGALGNHVPGTASAVLVRERDEAGNWSGSAVVSNFELAYAAREGLLSGEEFGALGSMDFSDPTAGVYRLFAGAFVFTDLVFGYAVDPFQGFTQLPTSPIAGVNVTGGQLGKAVATNDSGTRLFLGEYLGDRVELLEETGGSWQSTFTDADSGNYGYDVAFSPDGTIAIAGEYSAPNLFGFKESDDWSSRTTFPDPLVAVDGRYTQILDISSNASLGTYVVVTSSDYLTANSGLVHVHTWDGSATPVLAGTITGGGGAPYRETGRSLAVSANGELIIAGTENGAVAYRVNGDWVNTLVGGVIPVTITDGTVVGTTDAGSSVAIDAGGSVIAVGSAGDDQVTLYALSSSDVVSEIQTIPGPAGSGFGTEVSLSPDGLLLAVGAVDADGGAGDDGAVFVYAVNP